MFAADSLDDPAFISAFESLQLDPASFNHRNHLRLAWLYLKQWPLPEAAYRCADRIRIFAAHHGSPRKFHLTMTLALMHLIYAGMQAAPAAESFTQFCVRNPGLLNNARSLLAVYYSEAALTEPAARTAFVPPDLQPLPAMPVTHK